MNYYRYPLITFFLLGYIFSCTIGVARDVDGSAVLWKNRDVPFDSDQLTDLQYVDTGPINYLQIVSSSSSSPYIGFNEAGFAIANSVVQIDDDINCSGKKQQTENRSLITDEYLLIREALSTCSDIDCFNELVYNLQTTEYNIEYCSGLDMGACTDSDNRCYWSDSDTCGEGCFANHIQSNFAVIDNSGKGAIFEVRTLVSEENIVHRENLGPEDYDALYRSNHFKFFPNRQDFSTPYPYLDNYNCDNLEDDLMRGNARRWCSSEEYFSNLSPSSNSIIKYLIEPDPTLNGNRGAFLRSLSRSNPNNSNDIFFDLSNSFYEQAVYDCGKGRPSGYIWALNSVARRKTTSSTVIKSTVDNTDQSFVLVTLGNPLINPYFPIKISDFSGINDINFYPYTLNAKTLSDHIFDYGNDPSNPLIKRWVDSQHLVPRDFAEANHLGAFAVLKNNIESQYIIDGFIYNSLSGSMGVIDSFYDQYISGFNTGGYDDPIHKIAYREKDVSGCTNGIAPLYNAERIIDRTFHRDHSAGLTWVIEDPDDATNYFDTTNASDTINPIFTASDWSTIGTSIGNTVNIKMLDSSGSLLLTASNKELGCTNNDYSNYQDTAKIDNNTCENIIASGCMDSEACNYDSDAIEDDGSCQYPTPYEDCTIANGSCLNSADAPGNQNYSCSGFCNPLNFGDNLDAGGYDCMGECGGDAVVDCYDVCDGTAIEDCMGWCNGANVSDNCGVCEGNDNHIDCAGNCLEWTPDWNGEPNAEYDDCGDCGGGSYFDEEGLLPDGSCDCDGNILDECGVCNGSGPEDNYDCDGNCILGFDCNGVCAGVSVIDDCAVCSCPQDTIDAYGPGICIDTNFDNIPDTCEGGYYHGEEGNCQLCAQNGWSMEDFPCGYWGVCKSIINPELDEEGQNGLDQYCADLDTTVQDDLNTCINHPYCVYDYTPIEENSDMDECGECFGPGFNDDGCCGDLITDCAGECGGEALFDNCDECVEGNTGLEQNWAQDCNGDCFGEAFLDDCEQCVDGNTGNEQNWAQDCNGDCFGEAFLDDCEQCVDGNTGSEQNWAQDCNGDCFGEAVEDCDGNCNYSDLCGDLNGDSILNVLDVTALIVMILDLDAEINYSLSDMNNDDIVNIQDILILINIILNN